jgi:hypothetical protein
MPEITIAKLLNQPRSPSTDEWIKKMWCAYTIEFLTAIIKHEIMPFARKWMKLKIITLSQIFRKTNITCFLSDMESRFNLKRET